MTAPSQRPASELYVPELTPEGWQFHCPPPLGFKKQWLSSNDRDHWRKRGPLVKAWRDLGYQAGQHIPKHEKPYVVADISFADNRKRDTHNYMPTIKAIVDGLTDAGVWDDDNHKVLLGPDLRYDGKLPLGVRVSIFERLW